MRGGLGKHLIVIKQIRQYIKQLAGRLHMLTKQAVLEAPPGTDCLLSTLEDILPSAMITYTGASPNWASNPTGQMHHKRFSQHSPCRFVVNGHTSFEAEYCETRLVIKKLPQAKLPQAKLSHRTVCVYIRASPS